MTSCKLSSGSVFGHLGISAWLCCIFLPSFRRYFHQLQRHQHFMKFNVAAAHYVGSVRETGPPTKAYSRWLFPAQISSWSFMFENQGPKIFMFFREFDSHNVETSFRPHRYLFEPLQFSGFFSVNDPQKFSKIPSERYVSSDMDSWLKIILSILSSWPNFVKVGCWGVDEVSSGFENKKSTQLRWTRPSPTFLSSLCRSN